MLIGQRMLFCDDSIVRGTQLRDNTKDLYDNGAREVHMRISCPPLIYGCPFVNFSRSKGDLELLTRQIIRDFEGDANKNVEKYVDSNSPEYEAMIEEMRKRLNLSSLKFSSLDTLVASIGLPKCKICTHCFDGSSQYTLEQVNEA